MVFYCFSMSSCRKKALLQLKAKKRTKLVNRRKIPPLKVTKSFHNVEERVMKFREWCKGEGIYLNDKLYIGTEGSCHQIGVIATKDIPSGEVLARIPRTATLTASRSNAGDLMHQDHTLMNVLENPWIPLLIALTYELAHGSKWQPYLDLVPNNETCPPPMLWDMSEIVTYLKGTGVKELVYNDLDRINFDFNTLVLPFLRRHLNSFPEELHSKTLFKKLVSFVMSYSFTDASGDGDLFSQTMMVPFVDLLNHHDNHNAELSYHSKYLELVAIRDIERGKEVFNTFGDLPNYSLLHTYGFAIPDNIHDKACISSCIVKNCYRTFARKPKEYRKRWLILKHKEILLDSYDIDKDGEPENELKKLLKLLFCDSSKFRSLCSSYDDWTTGTLKRIQKEFLKCVVIKFLSDIAPFSCQSLMSISSLEERQRTAMAHDCNNWTVTMLPQVLAVAIATLKLFLF